MACHAGGAIAIDDGIVLVVQEEAEAEAEVLRHQRALDDEAAGGADGGLEALAIEAVAMGGAAYEGREAGDAR
jgi:hypothetical protein